jgi:5'-nucleotidase
LKILLINDDGIHAPGLWAAAKALRSVGELFVVAPDREQSGVGASLTLHAPLRVRTVPVNSLLESDGESPFEVTAYSAEGTPGDCAILGLEKLVGKVDLVVSGINSGSNLGWDTIVSGTVGGAIQGFVRGYPTIAISVGSVRDPIFDGAARLLGLVALRLRESPPDFPLFLNINVPSLQLDKLTGVQVTKLGGRSYGESVREEGVGAQRKYWISRDRPLGSTAQEGTDSWAVRNNQISITPLHLGLGNDDQVPDVETLLKDLPSALLSRRD